MNAIIKIIISIQAILIVGLVLLLTGVVDSSILDTRPIMKGGPSLTSSGIGLSMNNAQSTGIDAEINSLENILNDPLTTDQTDQNGRGKRGNGLIVEVNNPQELGDYSGDEFEEQPKLQELSGLENTGSGTQSYQSPLVPQEVFDITVNDGLWGYFARPIERIDRLKEIDPDLSLIDYRGEEFKTSVLYERLSLSPTSKIYVFLEFSKAIDSEMFSTLRSLGVGPVPVIKQVNYYKKYAGVFYVKYGNLKNIYRSSVIRSIHILANYTAIAKYELGILSSESTDDLEIKINYPYSKPGLKISDLEYGFEGDILAGIDNKEKNQYVVNTPIQAGKVYKFRSSHKVDINLLDNVNRNFVVAAKDLGIADYTVGMKDYPQISEIFRSREGEKIVPSEYVKNIVHQINTDMDMSGIWKQITFILDKDILYDWQKRELFFSGNLSYYDIKDMYLNVTELSEKKVGACTERTSLEIAILRELGIAARSATRVYHIFTEVFLPKKGWVSTSMNLNEIPLCHSYDENMAYFVEWNKHFPIRLKWIGKIYPSILSNYLIDDSLVKN